MEPLGPFFSSAGPDKDASTTPVSHTRKYPIRFWNWKFPHQDAFSQKIREISRRGGEGSGGAWLAERDGVRERERERETSTSKYGDDDEDG